MKQEAEKRENAEREMLEHYRTINQRYVATVKKWLSDTSPAVRYRQKGGVEHRDLYLVNTGYDTARFVFVAVSYVDINCYTRDLESFIREAVLEAQERQLSEIYGIVFEGRKQPYERLNELFEHIIPLSQHNDLLRDSENGTCDIQKLRYDRTSSDYDSFVYWEEIPVGGSLRLPSNPSERRKVIEDILRTL